MFLCGINSRKWNIEYCIFQKILILKKKKRKNHFKPKVNSSTLEMREQAQDTSVPRQREQGELFLWNPSHVIVGIQPPLPSDLYSHF